MLDEDFIEDLAQNTTNIDQVLEYCFFGALRSASFEPIHT